MNLYQFMMTLTTSQHAEESKYLFLFHTVPAEPQPDLKLSAIAVNNTELGHKNQTVGCQLRMHNYHNYDCYL